MFWSAFLGTSLTATELSAEQFTTKYTTGHRFVLARKQPTVRSRVVAPVPYGTRLECKQTDSADKLLGAQGHWNFCKGVEGYIFGPLLTTTVPEPAKFKYLIYYSRDNRFDMDGVSRFWLHGNRVEERGWYDPHGMVHGPGEHPRTEIDREGEYFF